MKSRKALHFIFTMRSATGCQCRLAGKSRKLSSVSAVFLQIRRAYARQASHPLAPKLLRRHAELKVEPLKDRRRLDFGQRAAMASADPQPSATVR